MMILNNFHMADAVYFASIRLIKPIAPLPKPKQTSCQFPASKTTRKQNHRILHIHHDLDPDRNDRSSTWRTSLIVTENNSIVQPLPMWTLCPLQRTPASGIRADIYRP